MNDPRDDARRDWSDLAAASGTAQPWSPPSPLFEGPTPPPFPIQEAFPLALAETRDFVIALAIEVQVPVDLVAMLLAAITSACLAQKFLIEARDGWRETAVIWVLVLLESGERKSVIFRRMTDAIHQWEKDQAERMAPEIAADEEKRQIVETRLKEARKKAGKNNADAEEEAIRLAQELAAWKELHPPMLVATDATSEAIVGMMVNNGERALVASPEGDALDVMMGRYDDKARPNLGIWLTGYTGDRVRVYRRGRKAEYLDRPALAVAMTVQPEAVRGLYGSRLAQGRGLLVRFFASVPEGMVGRRSDDAPPVPEHLEVAYINAIRRLLDMELDAVMGPRIVRVGPEASDLHREFRIRIERELRRGGDLSQQKAWGAKICGGILRIALALHCLEVHGRSSARSAVSALEVNADTMRAALSWAPYLIEHDRIASGIAGCHPETAVADRILSWLERSGVERFSRRDCFTHCRGRFVNQTEDVDDALKLLIELGYVRRLPVPAAGEKGGRPPSPLFTVNPLWNRGGQP